MKNTFGILLFAVVFTGCAAEMVEKHGDTIHLFASPTEKSGHGGVVRFLNGGLKSWKEARRANALKQMEKFCSGPYKVTAEGPRSKFGADMPIGNSVSLEVDQYTYIAFECEK